MEIVQVVVVVFGCWLGNDCLWVVGGDSLFAGVSLVAIARAKPFHGSNNKRQCRLELHQRLSL